jgi:hypothetical protein
MDQFNPVAVIVAAHYFKGFLVGGQGPYGLPRGHAGRNQSLNRWHTNNPRRPCKESRGSFGTCEESRGSLGTCSPSPGLGGILYLNSSRSNTRKPLEDRGCSPSNIAVDGRIGQPKKSHSVVTYSEGRFPGTAWGHKLGVACGSQTVIRATGRGPIIWGQPGPCQELTLFHYFEWGPGRLDMSMGFLRPVAW